MTLQIGAKLPEFNVRAVDGLALNKMNMDNVFIDINQNSYKDKWLVLFFYPRDFTFVCPTELAEFANLETQFKERDTQLLGASTDSEYVHWAWRNDQPQLKDLPYPLLADVGQNLSRSLGVLDLEQGAAQRATFIIDPQGIIRFSMVTDDNVGRNPSEVLRVLDALQNGGLCPCNWNKGEETIKVSSENKKEKAKA